ncbi:MAG: helix-turn-helix domain-containing protein [Holosporales bacterium]|jgi:transcriptional regulator with XRE-family HTH domain|nr:helix-turn-helix domain-containing protein [Holosporales bacterium]
MNINVHIGKKLQERRKKANLTLEQLSNVLHVTYQQVQKYESGKNKIPIDKLYDCACLFQLPIQYFFDGADILQESSETPIDGIYLPPTNGYHLNLLLAESNPEDEYLIRKVLIELDSEIKIFCVHNDVQVINFLKTANPFFPKPDLIFLDANISKKNDHALISEMKRCKCLQDTPIVIMANSICRDDLVRVYKNGAVSFLCKSPLHDKMKRDLSICIQYWGNIAILPSITWNTRSKGMVDSE